MLHIAENVALDSEKTTSIIVGFGGTGMSGENFFAEAHENSLIKATIIAKYFWAWAKIVEKHSDKIAYVDLFAGPGRYDDGTTSTPLLVLEQAIRDPALREKLIAIFNDAAPGNVASLTAEIAKLPGKDTLGMSRSSTTRQLETIPRRRSKPCRWFRHFASSIHLGTRVCHFD